MPPTEPAVRRADSAEHAQANEVLAQAFGDDPIMSWMIGPGRDISSRMTHLFGHMLGVELARGDHLVDEANGCNAVALWHDVDQWKTPPGEIVKMVPAAIKTFGRRLPRALQTLSIIEKVHPAEPHRHLAFIGVRPSHQGRGLMTAMWRDPR